MCGWTVHLEDMINLDVTQRLLWVPVDAYHHITMLVVALSLTKFHVDSFWDVLYYWK